MVVMTADFVGNSIPFDVEGTWDFYCITLNHLVSIEIFLTNSVHRSGIIQHIILYINLIDPFEAKGDLLGMCVGLNDERIFQMTVILLISQINSRIDVPVFDAAEDFH